MTIIVDITIPMTPVAKARPRKGISGFYTPESTKVAERTIRQYVQSHMMVNKTKATNNPVAVGISFYGGTGDIDNLAKLVLDACNGVAYKDDRNVRALVCRKLGSKPHRIVLTIEEDDYEF